MAYADYENVPLTLPKKIAVLKEISPADKLIYARLLVMGANIPHEVETAFITDDLGITAKFWRASVCRLTKAGLITSRVTTSSKDVFKKVWLITVPGNSETNTPASIDTSASDQKGILPKSTHADTSANTPKGNMLTQQQVTNSGILPKRAHAYYPEGYMHVTQKGISSSYNKDLNKDLNKEDQGGSSKAITYPQSVDEVKSLMTEWVTKHVQEPSGAWAAFLDVPLEAEGFFSYWAVEHGWKRKGKAVKSVQGSIATWLGRRKTECERAALYANSKKSNGGSNGGWARNSTEYKQQIAKMFLNEKGKDQSLLENGSI